MMRSDLGQPKLYTYLLLFKPYGVLSQFTEGAGRATLKDYVPLPGVFEVGRLDYESEGALLLTDDGSLGHRLTHPRYHVPKTYLAQVEGVPDEPALEALRRGVVIKGERSAPAEVTLLSGEPRLPPRPVPIHFRAQIPTSWLRLVLREGKKREVRHMTAAVGCPTLRLVRVAIGPLTIGDMQPGQWRYLSAEEVAALRRAAGA